MKWSLLFSHKHWESVTQIANINNTWASPTVIYTHQRALYSKVLTDTVPGVIHFLVTVVTS